MTTLRIALRVARGGGVAGAIRLGLMSVGIAVGVAAALFVVLVPLVLDDQARLYSARTLDRSYEGAEHTLLAREALGSWNGHRMTRVFVAEVSPDSPLPPGVARATSCLSRLPKPGRTTRLSGTGPVTCQT